MMHRKEAYGDGRRIGAPRMEVKAADVSADGSFIGYASVFGVVDTYGEVTDKGCFTDTISQWNQRAAQGRPLPMLAQHRSDEVIGWYDNLVEDDIGLRVRGQFDLDGDPTADLAYKKLKRGLITGLSIGFYTREDSWDQVDNVLHLKKVDLIEISHVTFPACPPAQIQEVKAASLIRTMRAKAEAGEKPRAKEIEKLLREVGFSQSEATAFTAAGYAKLFRGEPGGKAVIDAALSDLRGLLGNLTPKGT